MEINKKLCDQLIKLYEDSISDIKSGYGNLSAAKEYCEVHKVIRGLCLASTTFDEYGIYNSLLFKNRSIDSEGYIHNVPDYCNSIEEIIETLEFRLDFLKSLEFSDNGQLILNHI